jgi:hypothetical protein
MGHRPILHVTCFVHARTIPGYSFVLSSHRETPLINRDMGGASAKNMGLEAAPRELSETLPGMMQVMENSTREANGGLLCEW